MLKFRQGDFSLEDELYAGRPQKIETNELRALLNIYSAQTEKEFAEQLGVTQYAISICLHTMGKEVQKEGRWVLHELSKDNKTRRRDTALTLLSKFCITSLQAMKSGFFMIILNVENHRFTMVNLRYRQQSPI